jgi:hypothetical protein
MIQLSRPTGKEKNVAGQIVFVRSISHPSGGFEKSRPPFLHCLLYAGSAVHGENHYADTVCLSTI